MINAPEKSVPQRLLDFVLRQRQTVAWGLLIASTILFVAAGLFGFAVDSTSRLGFSVDWDSWPEALGSALLASVCLTAGGWLLMAAEERINATSIRILILATGGLCGLVLAMAAAARTWLWRNEVLFGGIEAWQGSGWWRLWVCAAIELACLGLMLASLLQAKSEERASPTLRRLLYGYNTVLTGLLLLANLAVLNILVYVHFPASYQWTKTRGIFELSSKTRNVLVNLKEPVHVYVVMPEGDRVYVEVRTLLDNLQALTRKLKVTTLFPDRQPSEVKALVESFPKLNIGRGLVVVYGNPTSSGKSLAAFIPSGSLVEGKVDARQGTQTLEFRGEDVLMSEINFLSAGRKKPIIYFTQNNREFRLNDDRTVQGLAGFRDQLRHDNFEVKSLWLRKPPPGLEPNPNLVVSAEVPADAAAVAIVNPQEPLEAETVASLRRYLRRNGKLLVVLGLTIVPPDKPLHTNLEPLLEEHGVKVDDGFVMRAAVTQDADLNIPAYPPEDSSNPIARAQEGRAMLLKFMRPMQPLGRSGQRRLDVLLQVRASGDVWIENNLAMSIRLNPAGYIAGLGKSGLKKKHAREDIPVAVAVADNQGNQPRLVVVGNSMIATNFGLGTHPDYYPFLENSLEWLLGRGERLGIPPLRSSRFQLDVASIEPKLDRMLWLPVWLMGVGIIGLGMGIWVVRRR